MDIKQALKKGTSAEDLRKDFDAQLAAAQEELEKENKTEVETKAKREALIEATLDYCKTLGLVSEEALANFETLLNNYLVQLEHQSYNHYFTLRDWHHLLNSFKLW
ncbi:MAG: hypothetical protein LUC37_02725 [Prevotella sp.]|nr:hypothetical protein [Prevotella sp.]